MKTTIVTRVEILENDVLAWLGLSPEEYRLRRAEMRWEKDGGITLEVVKREVLHA